MSDQHSDFDRAAGIFERAMELRGAARAAYLEGACAGDAALRAEIDSMLAAHDEQGDFLVNPSHGAPGVATMLLPASEGVGTVIGRYKLLQIIGEGGFGVVYLAEQREPVQRRVALKIIKLGMDTRQVIARFEAERQALALMDHPNIARVFDAGATETGRPYFVMELVRGDPITAYCDTNNLSTEQRLELFQQVCNAVQHAHQKGIIHRDIKPSNVLVTVADGRPIPKVIDFGIAKATSARLTEKTLFTEHRALIGTPEYMSPEQAEMTGVDIDTRSDIYSLGVLLYELLTGTTPFEPQQLRLAAFGEIQRIIREVEPEKPSTRLSTMGEGLPSVAAHRHSEPARLAKSLRGDLDWIVMKALEKDRTRRYETANGFAMDIQRHLAGEPVLAAPPSARYRLRKFARQHRAGLTTAAAIVLLLVAGVAVSTWQAVRATRAGAAERIAKLDAVAQTAQAQKRLTQIEKANDILGSIFENLDPKEIAKAERPLQAILVEKLDQAVAQLEGESIGDPLVVAAMQVKFGNSLLGLGEAGKAIVLLEKACATRQAKLGPDHPDTLISMSNLALAYQDAGKRDLALPLFEETLKLYKAKLGPEHPDTLSSMGNLALAYSDAGKLDLALPLFEETLTLHKANLGPEHPHTLTSMNNLAGAYQDVGNLDLALPLFEETLKLNKAKLGPEHPDTLTSMNNLAGAYHDAGKRDLALPLHEETLKLTNAKLGPDHPYTLGSMNNLAEAYQAAGKIDLALPLHEETLKLRKAKLGPEHPDTLTSMHNLAGAYNDAGKRDLALPLYEETLKLTKAKLGPDHPHTLTSMNNLAGAYRDAGKLDLALPLYEETLKLRKAKLGSDQPDTLASMNNLAVRIKLPGSRTWPCRSWRRR